ncbi:hypothetical protein Drose_05640 [Dactylosporangium roseum]|uniref:Uncharacterized protein n=1 Tax=Dactylosporangium roseum TaxID=47989 RepID=A0ABY5ZAC6_9ACTN|nr:hypothetical protein [Dactylosporangium roseum]UWZ37752.1 hypothetical protein Drose_05640 [Dactylosporangium roseum]
MSDSPLANPAVRDAIRLLRECGVTPEQYAAAQLTESWKLDGRAYPDRDAAFTAAQRQADETGKQVEVWLEFGEEADWAAESWIVEPGGL